MGIGHNTIRVERKIVTVCGSMRFWTQMIEVAQVETKKGHIVLMPFQEKVDEDAPGGTKLNEQLDHLHRDKIDMSSEIIVVMVDNYVGDSTQKEISHAAANEVKISFRNFPSMKAVSADENEQAKPQFYNPFPSPEQVAAARKAEDDQYKTIYNNSGTERQPNQLMTIPGEE